MLRRKYCILMKTPMGDRKRTMDVQIEQNKATGHLDILKHAEPFDGSVDANGYCRITGKLVTLMQTIPYTATGRMLPDSLHLSLQGGRNTFHITGIISSEK